MKTLVENKSVRILALGTIFFIAGFIFWILDKSPVAERRDVGVLQGAPGRVPRTNKVLENYPPPANFQRFNYKNDDSTARGFINFSGKCNDKYFAILIFKADLDYRNDPSRAVFNKAEICPENGKFSYNIFFSDLKSFKEQEYYAFAADQGMTGLWYNPK